jgi:hypothetical protein
MNGCRSSIHNLDGLRSHLNQAPRRKDRWQPL